jgi:hypothetical protein
MDSGATPMNDFELIEDEQEAGGLRKWVERIVLAAWIVTAVGAAAAIVGQHYAGNEADQQRQVK